MSFLIRVFLLVFIIERVIAMNMFEKFKIADYESEIKFTNGTYTADDLNFEATKFEFMIGFDRPLPTEVGHFDFNIVLFGSDGGMMSLT